MFDKLKNLAEGAKLDAVKKEFTDAGIDISGLDISIDGTTITLKGDVSSQADKDKILSLLKDDNLNITDSMSVKEAATSGGSASTGGGQKYTVVSGDTLWGIAEKFYGDGSKYTQIFEANRSVWSSNGQKEDPNILYPNWELVIP